MITTKKMTKKKKPTNSISAKPKNSLLKTLEEHKALTFKIKGQKKGCFKN